MDEIVYILINEAMPGYIKIGRTSDLTTRIRDLSRTAVPLPFVCFSAKKVKDSREIEKKLHAAYAKDRIDSGAGREFFKVPAEQAAAALDIALGEDVTPREDIAMSPAEKVAWEEVKERRPQFKFSFVGINPGTILTFYSDDSVTCIVKDDRNVEFEGRSMSTTEAAIIVLESKGKHWKGVSGPGCWEYEGETLYERRIRLEGELE